MNLLDLLFPRRCVDCGKLGSYICQKCRSKIKSIESQICPVCEKPAIDGITHPICKTGWGIDGLSVAVNYSGPIKNAIHVLKYQFVSDLIPELVSLVFPGKPEILPNLDLLIPVPLHRRRERERGFNQSLLIAKILGEKWGIPVDRDIISRLKYTEAQADLDRKERLTNLQNSFALNNPDLIKDKAAGLVDDVATTCVTLRECARVLKRAGAKTVWGIVLAHGS
jgi:competence protein ComFC